MWTVPHDFQISPGTLILISSGSFSVCSSTPKLDPNTQLSLEGVSSPPKH